MLKYITLSLLVFLPSLAVAQDKPPVLIEMFSSITCNPDSAIQKQLREFVESTPNAYMVNCRTSSEKPEEKRVDKYENPFCGEQFVGYYQKMQVFGMKPPMIVVNGRYMANNEDIMAAVNLGQAVDAVNPISVRKESSNLVIDLSNWKKPSSTNELYIYVYRPSEEVTIGKEPDSNALPHSTPFVTQLSYKQYYFRPVVNIVKIANWSGKEDIITYPLSKLETLDVDPSQLSYVAVLYSGSKMGDVIGVGEFKSEAEIKTSTSKPPQL